MGVPLPLILDDSLLHLDGGAWAQLLPGGTSLSASKAELHPGGIRTGAFRSFSPTCRCARMMRHGGKKTNGMENNFHSSHDHAGACPLSDHRHGFSSPVPAGSRVGDRRPVSPSKTHLTNRPITTLTLDGENRFHLTSRSCFRIPILKSLSILVNGEECQGGLLISTLI